MPDFCELIDFMEAASEMFDFVLRSEVVDFSDRRDFED